jgi:LAO/AO transport system kinase
VDPSDLVARVRAGDPRAIARMLSRAELHTDAVRADLEHLDSHTGRAQIVGITGVPGSGKSTLVAQLAAEIRKSDRKVGIVAVDPSSPYSGGSVLGDRVRMTEVARDPGVFVRSVASRGATGGLARCTHDAVDILDAGGYEVVIVETVGVGQDAVDIIRAAYTIVVVSPPGLGDEVQASKAGLLEVADIHVVSKGDKPEADRMVAELQGMLNLSRTLERGREWKAPAIKTSAVRGDGIAELASAIDRHHEHLVRSGELERRRRAIREQRMLLALEAIVRQGLERLREAGSIGLLDELASGSVSPSAAARRLLSQLAGSGSG